MSTSLKCSFCGKSEEQVSRLIAGANAHICDDCVASCNAILGASTPSHIGDDSVLASLPACDAAVDAAREHLQKRVDQLRESQVSWEVIGKALGVSRQAAWERFR
jgi:ATP-dependent protease Clp ATPase subunit